MAMAERAQVRTSKYGAYVSVDTSSFIAGYASALDDLDNMIANNSHLPKNALDLMKRIRSNLGDCQSVMLGKLIELGQKSKS